MAGQTTQKTFNMSLLAAYSPTFLVQLVRYIRSLFIKPFEVLSLGLLTQTVWLHQLPQAIKFPYTYVFYFTAGIEQY